RVHERVLGQRVRPAVTVLALHGERFLADRSDLTTLGRHGLVPAAVLRYDELAVQRTAEAERPAPGTEAALAGPVRLLLAGGGRTGRGRRRCRCRVRVAGRPGDTAGGSGHRHGGDRTEQPPSILC